MKVNLGVSPLSNVLALINAANGSSINETMVTAGVVTVAAGHAGENSQITLTGIDGKGIEGSETFFYNRYSLTGGRIAQPTTIAILATDSQLAIRTKIAEAYNLELSELIVNGGTDIAIPEVSQTVEVPMAVIDGSLLYVGDPIVVSIVLA